MLWKAIFYVGVTIAGLGGLGLCLLGIPRDPFINYTVVNNTDSQLITWFMEERCLVVVGQKGDYLETEHVPPYGTVRYSSFSDAQGCIQVLTADRRLIAARDYSTSGGEGPEIVITEPITTSATVPPESALPSDPDRTLIATLVTSPARDMLILYAALFFIVVGGFSALKASRVLKRKGVTV